jgi:signal transduction histidine kinase
MRARNSLRLKVSLAFSALAILLLVAQALGVKALAEVQEEKFINDVIADDMRDLMQTYRAEPNLVPVFDPLLAGHVSQEGGLRIQLPESVKELGDGTHEIVLDGREIHIALGTFRDRRIYRIYDFSSYEQHFKQAINALMIGTGLFALLTIWLAFALSGLLVRQITGLARQVQALNLGASETLNSGKYDEVEVVELAETFNDYHRRMANMIEREAEFTGNVSHELRTPLTTIKTSCELLEQDATLGTKSLARLRQIDCAADNMISLVNGLLLLARSEPVSDVRIVRLVDVIAVIVEGFTDVLAARKIEVKIEVDHELHVLASRSALAIVLSNLIDNAVRHTNEGRLHFFHDAGVLHFTDTGSGIAPEALPLVFERFYQACPDESKARGFGLGLAIVKQICDRYHWTIVIDSSIGVGTCVSVSLPLAA